MPADNSESTTGSCVSPIPQLPAAPGAAAAQSEYEVGVGEADDVDNTMRKRTRAQEAICAEQSAVLNLIQRTQKKQRSVYRMRILGAESKQDQSEIMAMLPDDVVGHIMVFCKSVKDRFMTQTICKSLRRICNNSDEILSCIKLGGNITGNAGIIQEDDTPSTASKKLTPFAKAGNLEAIYMLGMIKSYCGHDVDKGINLLRLATKLGNIKAGYTLGLILRDLRPRESRRYMNDAAQAGYLPALQEILPAAEMKSRFGEPSAGELSQYLDPVCLNRLLGRHYVVCPQLRSLSTSHCWNPLCGRWAFRAMNSQSLPVLVTTASVNSDSSSESSGILGEAENGDFGDEEFICHRAVEAGVRTRVSRMKMCSRCCRAKYCSKLCQVYDWRSGRHKVECPFLKFKKKKKKRKILK